MGKMQKIYVSSASGKKNTKEILQQAIFSIIGSFIQFRGVTSDKSAILLLILNETNLLGVIFRGSIGIALLDTAITLFCKYIRGCRTEVLPNTFTTSFL